MHNQLSFVIASLGDGSVDLRLTVRRDPGMGTRRTATVEHHLEHISTHPPMTPRDSPDFVCCIGLAAKIVHMASTDRDRRTRREDPRSTDSPRVNSTAEIKYHPTAASQ